MRRRTWIAWGLGAATVLAGGGLRLLSPAAGPGLPPEGRAVLRSVGAALLEGSLPARGQAREAALDGLLDRIDTLAGQLPAHARRELDLLLGLLASAPGRRWLAGLEDDWALAPAAKVQAALQALRVSPWALRQQAYLALHDLVSAAYFAAPATWAQVGYAGPEPV